MAINCMRFANSQQLRSRWSKPGSSGWAGVDGVGSRSERERFRETISAEGRRKARWRIWRFPSWFYFLGVVFLGIWREIRHSRKVGESEFLKKRNGLEERKIAGSGSRICRGERLKMSSDAGVSRRDPLDGRQVIWDTFDNHERYCRR